MEVEVGRYIAGALLTGFGALGAGIGIGTLTSKYIEACLLYTSPSPRDQRG